MKFVHLCNTPSVQICFYKRCKTNAFKFKDKKLTESTILLIIKNGALKHLRS